MYSLISLLITAISVLQILIIVRIVLSYFPGARHHPLGNLLCRIVDPILLPFRAVLPTFGGIDFSPMLALLVLYALTQILSGLQYGSLSVSGAIAFIIVQLILGIIVVFCLLILIRIVMSLLHAAPFHPMVLFVREVTNPLVRPFAGITPRRRGLEVEAVIALAAYIVLYVVARILLGHLL